MLTFIPFLLGPLAYGVIALLDLLGSIARLLHPVLASRGRAPASLVPDRWWAHYREAALLITLGILVDQGKIGN